MAVRLLEMHRILKDSGSIYLHCDPTMSHYLKLVMDAVVGKAQFRNEIVWGYSNSGRPRRFFAKKHDIILIYTKTDNAFWGNYRMPVSAEYLASHYRQVDDQGRRCRIRVDAGVTRYYYPEDGISPNDWWDDIPSLNSVARERLGYPTQKPLALLDRIIKASSNEGNLVFDPFCGCATTLVAADRLQRDWIGIDISAKAAELVVERIRDDQGLFEDIVARTDIPKRTDLGNIPRYNAPENKTQLYGEQGGDCNGCGEHFQRQHLEIDHIIAESVGGTDHIENLQLLCGHCNRIKGNRGQEYLISRLNKE